MSSLENLLDTWKSQPDEATTILLCDQLGTSGQPKLVEEVGRSASVKYASNPEVLLAIGRMYLHAYRLGDAQGLLVSAGKMAPRNADIYRWLGEVLLRRGDAARACKILERAVVLGKTDDETQFWRSQAEAHVELQTRSGPQKVVAALTEVLREKGLPLPPPPSKRGSGAPTAPAASIQRVDLPPEAKVSDARPDLRKETPEPPAVVAAADETPIEVPRRVESSRPPASPFAQVGEPATSARPISVPPATPPRPDSSKVPLAPHAAEREAKSAAPAAEPASAKRSPLPEAAAAPAAPSSGGEAKAKSTVGREPDAKSRSRFSIVLLVAAALVLLGGIGALVYARDKRGKRAEARALDDEVTKLLKGGKISDLPVTETKLARAWVLEPKSPETALLWLRNRVLKWLETEGDSAEIEGALGRAQQNMVAEPGLAFARIASLLAQGDTARAIALISQWDERAKGDAHFQLLAGHALERAGDARAMERFQLAVNLDPELVPAQLMLARDVALEGERGRAVELARFFRGKWPERAEGAALIALTWARDPARGAAPPEAELARNRRDELPAALRTVPLGIDALQAIERGSTADARAPLERGIAIANTPGAATWLGTLALEAGDDALARGAAMQARASSAGYAQAHVLSSRIALAQGRLDEAVSAIAELAPSLPDVAIVRAAVAYERLDLDGLSALIDGLPAAVRAMPELAALTKGPAVLRGDAVIDASKLRGLASVGVSWGDVILVDAELYTGALGQAKELIDRFREAKDRPPYALRVSQYLRSTGHAADADAPSRTALGMPTARTVVERAEVLVSTDRGDEARALVAKNASLLGPMAPWALAYVDARGPRAADTRAKAAALEPPGPGAPLTWRVVSMSTMIDLGDKKRGIDLMHQLAKAVPRNPDVLSAAEGARK